MGLWDAIHILAKTYNSTNKHEKMGVIGFFESLRFLMPHQPWRHSLTQFMAQEPLTNYTHCSDSLFEWTYKLHNYVNMLRWSKGENVRLVSYEMALQKYQYVDKAIWGNAVWFVLHYLAAHLPDTNVHDQLRKSFKALVVSLAYVLPCIECRKHMYAYISQTGIDEYLSSGHDAFMWTWKFHNSVNRRVGKQEVDFDPYYKFFRAHK